MASYGNIDNPVPVLLDQYFRQCKSGVGGGIVAVVPGRCTLSVWSPGRGHRGNSVAGVAALPRFGTLTGLSVF